MKAQILRLMVIGGLLVSSALTAEPLNDLRTRLAAMRSTQPIRLKVDVELKHKESAPLHRRSSRIHGHAVVVYGRRGVQVRGERWSGSTSNFSLWTNNKVKFEAPLIDEGEAELLIDPAGVMDYLLRDASLLSDESGTWQGQSARLLVIRPTFVDEKAASNGAPWRFTGEIRIWLNDSGSPLAMENTQQLRVESALTATKYQTLTFQELDGRLLAARTEDTFSGTALAMLEGSDSKTVKVRVDR